LFRFRLKGLAETFVDSITCPCCGNNGGDNGEQGFHTDLTRVTFDGIIVVIQCEACKFIFVPDNQRCGIINSGKLRDAIENDSFATGQPIFPSIRDVRLDVERLNALLKNQVS
jgi:hypothetical protein